MASARSPQSPNRSASRCATTSVSVSDSSRCPRSASSSRSAAKFSMIPLWTTATRPALSRWGCALMSVGPPWVAHRVCPSPAEPAGSGCPTSSFSRLTSLPAFLAVASSPSVSTATPAES